MGTEERKLLKLKRRNDIMRLIDATEFSKYLDDCCDTYSGDAYVAIDFARDRFHILKEVDAQPVIHAKWNLSDGGDGVVCSNCGEDFCTMIYEETRMLYCPHCGAKMDRKDDNND